MRLVERIPPLAKTPIVGIIRGYGREDAVAASVAVADAGIEVLEVTYGSPDVLETIESLAGRDGLVVGVGTVTTVEQLRAATSAGAAFVVTPVFVSAVVSASQELDLPIICGAASPTEIHAAHVAGATAVKVFPAVQLGGPGYLRAVLAPLGPLDVVPTGGVSPENAGDYFDAGAVAVGAGSGLFSTRVAADGDWAGLSAEARRWVEAVR